MPNNKRYYNTRRLMQAEIVLRSMPSPFSAGQFKLKYNLKHPDDELAGAILTQTIQCLVKRDMVEPTHMKGYYVITKRRRKELDKYAKLLQIKKEAEELELYNELKEALNKDE